MPVPASQVRAARSSLRLEHATSIRALDAREWDALLGDRGTFTAGRLAFLESAFRGHQAPESNWAFHYYVVRDAGGRPVLATFFTDALWKDDMLSSAEISRQVEKRRALDPYFLTSRCLAMGSLLTEGDHLYLDRDADWRGAMALLLAQLRRDQVESGASRLVLRDLPVEDAEMDRFLLEQGFAKFPMPASMHVTLGWKDHEDYLAGLSQRSRRLVRREVLARHGEFHVDVYRQGEHLPDPELLGHFRRLYKNVKDRNPALNTFDLPSDVFHRMLQHPEWELSALFLGQERLRPVAISADFVGRTHYSPMIIGLDYDHVFSHGVYRQSLYRAIFRARELGAERVYLGMGAELEKSRFGAVPTRRALYVQAKDQESAELLGHLGAGMALPESWHRIST